MIEPAAATRRWTPEVQGWRDASRTGAAGRDGNRQQSSSAPHPRKVAAACERVRKPKAPLTPRFDAEMMLHYALTARLF